MKRVGCVCGEAAHPLIAPHPSPCPRAEVKRLCLVLELCEAGLRKEPWNLEENWEAGTSLVGMRVKISAVDSNPKLKWPVGAFWCKPQLQRPE